MHKKNIFTGFNPYVVHMTIYIIVCVCVYIYIYIYIYTHPKWQWILLITLLLFISPLNLPQQTTFYTEKSITFSNLVSLVFVSGISVRKLLSSSSKMSQLITRVFLLNIIDWYLLAQKLSSKSKKKRKKKNTFYAIGYKYFIHAPLHPPNFFKVISTWF